jgi:SAM-dependent methyltransferase
MPEIDADQLTRFVSRAVDEVGATLNAALVVMGDRLGLYRALAASSGLSPSELAERSGVDVCLTREWLNAQTAGDYVEYDPDTGRYTLPPEQRVALTDPASPDFLPGLFQLAVGAVSDFARVAGGLGWSEHCADVHEGSERFLEPRYRAHLVADWLPALDGVVAKLARGGRVSDVGCGAGAATLLMAEAFPQATFDGSDPHAAAIEIATRRAQAAGLDDRVRFHTTSSGRGYDLVTMLDCLHDMGDPVGAARHVRRALADDGTWMIVAPRAGDRLEDNLNPVGRAYYGLSVLLCLPASLAQDVGLGLGAQAGEARIRGVAEAAGFARFRRVAEAPLHLVFEARP